MRHEERFRRIAWEEEERRLAQAAPVVANTPQQVLAVVEKTIEHAVEEAVKEVVDVEPAASIETQVKEEVATEKKKKKVK